MKKKPTLITTGKVSNSSKRITSSLECSNSQSKRVSNIFGMKCIAVMLLFLCTWLSASAQQPQYPEELLKKIRVNSVTLEGNNMGLFIQKAHISLTNTSDERVSVHLYVVDNNHSLPSSGDGKPTDSYVFCSEFVFSADAGETAEVVSNYVPWHNNAGLSTLHIAGLLNKADDRPFYELYKMDINVDETTLPACSFKHGIEGTDETVKDGFYEYKILRTNKLKENWSYTNLEDYDIYNGVLSTLHACEIRDGIFTVLGQVTSRPFFYDIKKGETKSGSVDFDVNLKNGMIYRITHVYGFVYPAQPMWMITTGMGENETFKVEFVPTGIDEIEENENMSTQVYTLGGVRVTDTENLPKGIYIRGGKKFVVK